MHNLTDSYIIDNCKALVQGNLPKFLSKTSKESLTKFLNSCIKNGNIPIVKIDEFHDIWKNLLSDAITYLKLKDKREVIEKEGKPLRDQVAFGVNELHRYFEEYRSFEAFLYGADRFYRDHIMHVFRVWILGIWLIEQFNHKVHWDLKEINIRNDELAITNDEIAAMWCIIALTHDLGYPLDKVEKVRKKIDEMMNYFGGTGSTDSSFQIPTHHHFINDFILKFISSRLVVNNSEDDQKQYYQTTMQSKYYLKFSRSFENFYHGIISCVLLMKNLVYFLESDFDLSKPFTNPEDARQFYIRREILRAIAAHTSTDIYHLYPNSFPFILILSDELQAWGRPTFWEMKSGRQDLELQMKVPEISEGKIKIGLEIKELGDIGGDESGGREKIFSIFRKWHKWLRSALGASDRKFVFSIKAKVISSREKSTEYEFVNEPFNEIKLYIGGKESDLYKTLYS